MKLIYWLRDNFFFLSTLLLLAFIPLYPKKPLVDIVNTWVYVRAEDFIVLFILAIWFVYLIKKKLSFKTPLTIPILIFWVVGAAATFHGILIIFPQISNVFPNVAFFSFLRRIEYVSLFFIGYEAIKNKKLLPYLIIVLLGTLVAVIVYGFGQKYFGYPAYLTMNEEFAKGAALKLSALSRVSSTFGGHYDLAAYLVLVLPIVVSLFFALRSIILKFILIIITFFGFGLLFFTVSRISFFALLVSIFFIIFIQKKKLLLFFIPFLLLLIPLIVNKAPTLINRFDKTIQEVDVLIDAKNNTVIGHPITVPAQFFKDKIIRDTTFKSATESAFLDYTLLPSSVLLITTDTKSTGEDLPEGSAYINLSLSPIIDHPGMYLYENPKNKEVLMITGNLLVKRVRAYDLSSTTRFQGGWPIALTAFKRNLLLGSGYGSATLAVDNSYLRMLAETGLIGIISFFMILGAVGIYIRKIYPSVTSPISKSFILGYSAGVIGLCINALLIDVFEASKVALLLWLLTGIVVGLLMQYKSKDIDLIKEGKNIITSPFAVIFGLLIFSGILFSGMLNNYFAGDDYTWFRWIADCQKNVCNSISHFFTHSDGFFYRPGTKLYFQLLYKLFWLNETLFHFVSLALHFLSSVLVFLIGRKIFNKYSLAVLSGFLFLTLSGFSEAVFWISSTGHLIQAVCSLLSLYLFILWTLKKNNILLVVSLFVMSVGLLFHELGIITPLLLILYDRLYNVNDKGIKRNKIIFYVLLFIPIILYLIVRYISQSHWLSGDYNYNILKLPFNSVGNLAGYSLLSNFGPIIMPLINSLRLLMKDQIILSVIGIAVLMLLGGYGIFKYLPSISKSDKKVLIFGFLFFVICLLPFLGFGNISSRYVYLASVGSIFVFVFFTEKLFFYMMPNGKRIAYLSVSLFLMIFILFNIIQIQQIQRDWNAAGVKIKNLLSSIDANYDSSWKNNPMIFYFVNVPIKQGDAWVLPVGLSDVLWFSLRNPNISVRQVDTLEQAVSSVQNPLYEKIFIFQDSGKVVVYTKPIIPTLK